MSRYSTVFMFRDRRACLWRSGLTQAAQLTDDAGQRDVGHTLQLVLDSVRKSCVTQVTRLDTALDQRHPERERERESLARSPHLRERERCTREREREDEKREDEREDEE